MQGSNSAYPLILIIWNELTNTGRAMLIQYDDVAITAAMENGRYTSTAYKQEADLFWHLDQVWGNGPDAGVLASVITVVKSITIDQTFLNYLTSAGLDSIEKMLAAGEPVTPVTPGSTVQGTVGNGFAAISGAWNNAFNDLTAVTSTSNNEIAPGLSLGQSSSSAAAGTSTTSASSTVAGIPVGAILGGLFLILAGILLYLGRNTIVAVIKGYGRPGK
jgi:cobalamin biosynthesis Mg chelatase CobN